jgi:hypothetical protein
MTIFSTSVEPVKESFMTVGYCASGLPHSGPEGVAMAGSSSLYLIGNINKPGGPDN